LKDLANETRDSLADYFENQIKFQTLQKNVDKNSNIPKKWN
jgi:hypothetical protein